tara:strand:+ start:2017 stop:2934 length:918 start_codon:yes stop_codon:yes gene_type:complete
LNLYNKLKELTFVLYITGGIGNQLFQFATAYAYAKMHKKKVYINIDNYSWARWSENLGFDLDKIISPLHVLPKSKWTIFVSKSNPNNLRGRIIRKLFWKKGTVFIEKQIFSYDKSLFLNDSWDGLFGYFQSPFYFESVREEIRAMIKLQIYSQGAINYKNKITSLKSAVAIHYRDFSDPITGSEKTKNFHGEHSLNYYKKAIDIVNKKVTNPTFFIFSNDINSAKLKFSKIKEVNFIDYKSKFNWEDMALMSMCEHNIICNSSYSWWAAYLNKNKKGIVVAPKTWGNLLKGRDSNLFPKEWILLN